jgi:hypothetical protein
MPRLAAFLVCILLALTSLATVSFLNPDSVLAGPGILQFDASLQNEPRDDSYSISWLPAGTEVYVTGDPSGDYYPVTVGVLSGWIRTDALVLEELPAGGNVAPGAATPVGSVGAIAPMPIEAVAQEPLLDPNAPSVAVPDPGPIGPAAVMADVSIYAGPGPDFGVLGTAATGQVVEQTGHAVSGYVTVRYVGVTGWVSLDYLGPPPAQANG